MPRLIKANKEHAQDLLAPNLLDSNTVLSKIKNALKAPWHNVRELKSNHTDSLTFEVKESPEIMIDSNTFRNLLKLEKDLDVLAKPRDKTFNISVIPQNKSTLHIHFDLISF